MKKIDMMGQPCPIPVITAKKELARPATAGVEVLVDNIVAVQNLEKMAKGSGHTFLCKQTAEDIWSVCICPAGILPGVILEQKEEAVPAVQNGTGLCILITSNCLGRGADDLGRILMKGFLFSLTELPTPPQSILFLNSGAQLSAEGANTLPDLQRLVEKGTKIFTCGTCLNYFGLTEKLAVGTITDMMGIATTLSNANRLLTL